MGDPVVLPAHVSLQRIFPMHLAPLETFILADDQPRYPMTFVVQLQLAGELDREAFAEALKVGLARHPLLQALVQPGKGGRLCWTPAVNLCPVIDWEAAGTPITCPQGEGIDLSKEIGVRVWVRQGAERVMVTVQFHHACADGTAAYRFLGDVLAGYGIRTAAPDQRPALVSLDPNLLRKRQQRTLNLVLGKESELRRRAIRTGLRVLFPRPTPLAASGHRSRPQTAADRFPGFLSVSFDRADHQRLRDYAGRCGVMPNDVLLANLFETMAGWSRRQRSWWPGRWLRIMMPTDLRSGEDIEMPAANLTSYTFLTRRRRDCAPAETLLQSIRNETGLVKHERAGTAFVDAAFAASRVRGLLPFLLSWNLCLATAVLSNAADPSRRFTARFPRQAGRIVCGNLVLEEITGVPPLRAKTRATFSISQYERRLTISLRCDPHLFGLDDTAALLDLYAGTLRQAAGLGEPVPVGGAG